MRFGFPLFQVASSKPSTKGNEMPRTDVRRIVFKFAVLVAMIGALFIYRSDTRAQYGSPGCDNDYQYCVQQCTDQGGDPDSCRNGSCATGYFGCWQNENPPIAQPQRPCPQCVSECDFYQQQCLAEGTRTPQQCAYTTFRCKQRCNYYCIY